MPAWKSLAYAETYSSLEWGSQRLCVFVCMSLKQSTTVVICIMCCFSRFSSGLSIAWSTTPSNPSENPHLPCGSIIQTMIGPSSLLQLISANTWTKCTHTHSQGWQNWGCYGVAVKFGQLNWIRTLALSHVRIVDAICHLGAVHPLYSFFKCLYDTVQFCIVKSQFAGYS